MAKKILLKLLDAAEFVRWDEMFWFAGWLIGRAILIAVSFAAGYVGINVVIGVIRWIAMTF